jgi:hypothetical protein
MSEFDGTTQAETSNLNNKGFNAKSIDDSKECDDGVCEDWEQLNQQVINVIKTKSTQK